MAVTQLSAYPPLVADVLASQPALVQVHNGRVISTDGDAHAATCDVCDLLWPDRTLIYRHRSETYECPLCSPGPVFTVLVTGGIDAHFLVEDEDKARAYADRMVSEGYAVHTDL